MLFRLLDKVVERIEKFEVARELPAFVGELKTVRADLFGPLSKRLGQPGSDRVGFAIAGCQLGLIKEIPIIVDSIRQAVEHRSTHPAVRCAMVGALAYLAKPQDLISDDRPGGFGFVDDCMILRATMSEYFDMFPPGFTSRDRERNNLRVLAVSVAPELMGQFQDAVDGVWRLFHSLLVLAPGEVEQTTEDLIQNPLDLSFPMPEVESGKLAAGPILAECLEAGSIQLENERVRIVFPDGVAGVLEG